MYEIIAHENDPYATVLYSRKCFWTKRWHEDYRRDQRQKLYDYLTTICRGEPLRLLEEEGKKWSESVGGAEIRTLQTIRTYQFRSPEEQSGQLLSRNAGSRWCHTVATGSELSGQA